MPPPNGKVLKARNAIFQRWNTDNAENEAAAEHYAFQNTYVDIDSEDDPVDDDNAWWTNITAQSFCSSKNSVDMMRQIQNTKTIFEM